MTKGFPNKGGRHGDAGLKIGRDGMEPVFDFIDRSVADEKPFFVWYAPFLPHTPHDAPEKFQRAVKANPRVEPHQALYYASISQFDDTVGQLVRLIDQPIAPSQLVFFNCQWCGV